MHAGLMAWQDHWTLDCVIAQHRIACTFACLMQDGLVLLQLLKRNRRGAYADGSTNADTFWPAVRLLAVHDMNAAAQM